MNVLNIELDYLPPSVNNLYRKSINGHIYVPKSIKDYKAKLKSDIIKHKDINLSDEKIRLILIFHLKGKRSRDTDNLLKVMLDAMNKVIYTDDKQVMEIHCKKVCNAVANKTVIKAYELTDEYDADDEDELSISF
jgi:Holliday junction resolvase RusA-like endonuclease